MSRQSWQLARRVAEHQDWLLTSGQAARAGLTAGEIAAAVRRRELRRVVTGVYLFDPDLYADIPRHVAYRAALLAHGDGACLVGIAAARTWGVEGLPHQDEAIEVALVGGLSRRRRASTRMHTDGATPPIVVRQLPVHRRELRRVGDLVVRAVATTVVDAALQLDRPSALSVLDSALHLGLLCPDEMYDALGAAKGRPGVQQLRPLVEFADGRAESPLESRIRLICIDGGVPPDDLQHEVRDRDGRLAAVGDLAWLKRSRPLLGEADGTNHALPKAVYRDRRRGNFLVTSAYDTVRFVWADSCKPAYVLDVVRSALASA